MNLWPYNMIRLWDSKEVFHTKSNICHFPSETVPQLLQNRAAWEKPSNGAKPQPWSSVPSCFPVYFCFNFYLHFLFLFFIWVVSEAQSQFHFLIFICVFFFCLCLSLLGLRTIPSILCNFIKCKFHSFLIGVE